MICDENCSLDLLISYFTEGLLNLFAHVEVSDPTWKNYQRSTDGVVQSVKEVISSVCPIRTPFLVQNAF